MAITFDPLNKVIQLDRYTVSERELWTAFVDWAVQGDNLKYGEGMEQLGGKAPVALYITLATGWRIRPLSQAGVTSITGNIETTEGDSPIEQAIGVVQVNLVTPVQAVALEVAGGTSSGLTEAQSGHLFGLDTSNLDKPVSSITANCEAPEDKEAEPKLEANRMQPRYTF